MAKAIDKVLDELNERLKGEYGGTMEYLFIYIELVESFARSDAKPRFPFRFQKRVSGHSRFGLPAIPDKFNVGHYSVRPDFHLITSLNKEDVVPYFLSLIYASTSVLFEKQKRLGGFNAVLFRNNFLNACRSIGYEISDVNS